MVVVLKIYFVIMVKISVLGSKQVFLSKFCLYAKTLEVKLLKRLSPSLQQTNYLGNTLSWMHEKNFSNNFKINPLFGKIPKLVFF